MTGRWRSPDGGTYYLRQAGSCVWFAGYSADTGVPGGVGTSDWTNSFFGELGSDFILRGEWADLPWGDDNGVGMLDWHVGFAEVDGEEAITLEVIDATGGFGAGVLLEPEMPVDLVVRFRDVEGCVGVVADDGATFELASWPDGWSFTTQADFLGPNGEVIGPSDEFVITGEAARGDGLCGPGWIIFVDTIETSAVP